MDSETIERAIDEELEKLNLNVCDVDSDDDTETEDDFAVYNGKLENDFPESMLTYFEASRNRVNIFEQLILGDLEEKDTTYVELSHQNHFDNLLHELAPEEDLMKLKERVISEIEEHVAHPNEVDESSMEDTKPAPHMDDETQCDVYNDTERQLMFEWRELEEKLMKEEEQRLAEQEAEKDRYLSAMKKEEEKRRFRLEEFEEDLRKIENTMCEHLEAVKGESHTKESLQLEVAKQHEVIKRLEEQIEEEKRAYEEAHQEERRRTEERHCGAATKLQAAFRGALARRWSKNELIKRKEEEMRRQEEIKERERKREREERMKREWEEERRRAVEEEQRQKEKLERRRAEYERAKELERHRQEKEREAEEQKGREEEAKRMEEARKSEESIKRMEEERKRSEEQRRKAEENELKEAETKKLQENERKGMEEEVIKSNEKDEHNMKKKIMREVEKSKRTEEQEMEEEARRADESRCKERKRKEEEKSTLEHERQLIQEENRKEIVEKESKVEEGKVMKNEKKDGDSEETIKEKQRSIVKEDEKGMSHHKYSVETDIKNTIKNCEKGEKEKRNAELVPQCSPCPSQTAKSLRGVSRSPPSSSNGYYHICSAPPNENTIAAVKSSLGRMQPEFEIYGEKSEMDTRGRQCDLSNSLENTASSSICLPDSTEQKRLAWMMNCTPWSKLSMRNKKKGLTSPTKKRGIRRASVPSLPPLPLDTVLKSGPWNSLRQVTTVILEDLPGCSLSTLSECTSLQSLTLRRCGIQALEGLNQCSELRFIDVQENSITYVDLGSLHQLEVLLLGRNKLTSIHGLDDAVNLTRIELSYNIISRISGLGALKRLQRLSVDHNQLISTRGLSDVFTLLYLDCSYNLLSHVESLEHCALLHTLDLKGNGLTEFPVLKNHVLLRELYLDDNSISSLCGLDSCWLPLLRCLTVAHNNITQLPLLEDLLSLRKLDGSHNCLSELRNVCLSVQGCTHLQELNLMGNPLQQENNWRLSVLTTKPSLIKLNGDQIGVSVEPSVGSTQPWSFQGLCQAHQDQLDSILQKHYLEISLSPTVLDAQLLVSNHSKQLFQLAEEQRYAHEYGDSSVSETASHELAVSSCLQDLSDRDLLINGSTQQLPAKQESQSQPGALLIENVHSTHPEHPAAELPPGCAGGYINPPQTFGEQQPRHSRHIAVAPRMDLKTMAAMVIQHYWLNHRQRRRAHPPEQPALAHGRLSPQKGVDSKVKKPDKDYAATVIQAIWRGYALRKRLANALSLAQLSEGEEVFEEVDMNEFVFDEEAMESGWIAPHSDASSYGLPPYSEQLLLPKPPLLLELPKSTPVLPWKPKQAWAGSEAALALEQSLSPDPNPGKQSPPSAALHCALSGRSEKFLEEWGISSGSTALLMLKRAQKMKAKKPQQRKLLDPAVRLALFRQKSKQPVSIEGQKKSQPKNRNDIKAGRAELSVKGTLNGEPGPVQQDRMYEWLHTQAVQTKINSATPTSGHFLPEIDPDILNGGRVQLVAGTRYRESPDSAASLWSGANGFFPPPIQQAHVRRHSVGHAKKELPAPKRVTSAPSRKERISFRDNPVQLSGGWGGGKKRAKVNK